ncbi:hypothetical protein, conserved [Plasmodium gonderi]|uniref:Cyclic nucleotide-binding domain-containing protein n=1 Tax=Plasmodium gonderi TaxID=77519 RepID=A0A1Y1JQB5_PLAGO|nr:hypothetical protein, conserved [Plasmodium gonderi]GAW83042.1 hypothetical protein, conserved [Plasmodium gonderi]
MDDLELGAIENIHDYLKVHLHKSICKTKSMEEQNDINDVSLIYNSLKKYVLRLTNINNFIKQENNFLRKKNDELIKKCNERDISKIFQNKKGTHGMYLNEIHKLSNENEFMKYKLQKLLRNNISLEKNNVELNNTLLLNRDNYALNGNIKSEKIKLKCMNLNESPNKFLLHQYGEHVKLEYRNENGNLTHLVGVNSHMFGEKINRIHKCAKILEEILNILNSSLKYDDPVIFQKKVDTMKIEKEELIMQNEFLKEKILQIETFILSDPFLVEKFNFFYNSNNINCDKSIRNNSKLYNNNNIKMIYHNLCSSENKNIDLKQQLSYEKERSHIYRTYMYDMRDKLKNNLKELFRLYNEENINFHNIDQSYDSIDYFKKKENLSYANNYHHVNNDKKNTEHVSEKDHCKYNCHTDLSNSEFYSMFKVNSDKIDYNQKMLKHAWTRIKELNQDTDNLNKRKSENSFKRRGHNAILDHIEECMKDEVYYFEIKELIRRRKKELDEILKSNINPLDYPKKDNNKLEDVLLISPMKDKEMLRERLRNHDQKLRMNNLQVDKHNDIFRHYINRKIISQYIKYKHIYDFYVQNKGVWKNKISKEKFMNFFKKHILNFKNDNTSRYNQKNIPYENQNRPSNFHYNRKVLNSIQVNETRESAYMQVGNDEYHDVTLDDPAKCVNRHSDDGTFSRVIQKEKRTERRKEGKRCKKKKNYAQEEGKGNRRGAEKRNRRGAEKRNRRGAEKRNRRGAKKRNRREEEKRNRSREKKGNRSRETKRNRSRKTKRNRSGEAKRNRRGAKKRNRREEEKRNRSREKKGNRSRETKRNRSRETKRNRSRETKRNRSRKTKEIEAERRKEIEEERRKEIEEKRRKEIEAERRKEIEAERRKEIEAERRKEIEAERRKEIEAERRKEIEAERQKEIEAERRKEIKSKEKQSKGNTKVNLSSSNKDLTYEHSRRSIYKDENEKQYEHESCDEDEINSVRKESFKEHQENSENFYVRAEYPRRHDSSLEMLRNTIENINKKKIGKTISSDDKKGHLSLPNSEDIKNMPFNEVSQSSFITMSSQNNKDISNLLEKKDSNQNSIKPIRLSKEFGEHTENEIKESEMNANQNEKFSSDEIELDIDKVPNKENVKKRTNFNLLSDHKKEEYIEEGSSVHSPYESIEKQTNPSGSEKILHRGNVNQNWSEIRLGAEMVVTERRNVRNKTMVGSSETVYKIRSRNAMKSMKMPEFAHVDGNVQMKDDNNESVEEMNPNEQMKDVNPNEQMKNVNTNEQVKEVNPNEQVKDDGRGTSHNPDLINNHAIHGTKKREKLLSKNYNDGNFFESEDEYDEQDFFDNNKYANVKIQEFRQILDEYDKNVYAFFMNLILYSKINLIKSYKNKVFNVHIEAKDILQYLLSNYLEHDKCKSKEEGEDDNSYINNQRLTEVEYKHINEYICNNSNTSSLKILYHKINFINNESYESFKNRLLEGGAINLINLFHDEDINDFDKIFDVSFVNFCDIVGISKDSCIYHFKLMDKNYKGKRYIYLKHILQYLDVEKTMKEEFHKYNFFPMHKKNLIYIHISESFDNLNEFFKYVNKKNKLYISLNEFIYFFSQNEKMEKYNYSKEEITCLYYSILFYVYYTNKNKILQTLQFFNDEAGEKVNVQDKDQILENAIDRNEQISTHPTEGLNRLVNESNNGKLTPNDGHNYSNYNLSLYKEYFSLDDFKFAIELKDLYFYFEGFECPFSKIKRRIVEIYGSVKKGILINQEICKRETNTNETNSSESDKDMMDLNLDVQIDSFHLFTKHKYRYMHSDRVFFCERQGSSENMDQMEKMEKIGSVTKRTFMSLMYNIGIHIDHCLTLWDGFSPFLECDVLDYKIFSGFLNGKINISNEETEESIKNIKNMLMNTHEEKEKDSICHHKSRLVGTICSGLLKNLNEKDYSTQVLTVDEIEVVAQVLNNVIPFNFLDKKEKKNFIQQLKKKCFKKGHNFASLGENVFKNKTEITQNESLPQMEYQNNNVVILLNGILKHSTNSSSFINSINVIDRDNICFYTAHTNVAVIEIEKELYTTDFVNLVEKKREVSKEFLNIIDKIPIFKNFPHSLKNSLSVNIQKCEYEKKKVIIRQHDDPSNFYILKEGEIHFYCNNEKTPISVISNCSFFGEIALIFNTLRTCDVVVESDVAHCYCISREYFLSLLNKQVVQEFVEYFRNYKHGVQHIIKNYENSNPNFHSICQEGEFHKLNEKNFNDADIKSWNDKEKNGTSNFSHSVELNSSRSDLQNGLRNSWRNSLNNQGKMGNKEKELHSEGITNKESSISSLNREISRSVLSGDNVTVDVEYINQHNISSFYSDLDKVLLKFFNTEQKYFVEEMESHLMNVKVLKDILENMNDKENFLKHLKCEKYPRGKNVILEGDFFEKFYFVKEGEISIQQFNQYKNMYEQIYILKKNHYFGHQLILSKTKSDFIAVATVDTELFTLEASLYEQYLSPFIDKLNRLNDIKHSDVLTECINHHVEKNKKDEDFIIKVINILKKVSIIQKLNDDEMYKAAKNFNFKFFKKGKVIIKYNDTPDHFYIIKKGIVSVKMDDKETTDTVANMNKLQSSDNDTNKIMHQKSFSAKSVYLHKYDYFGELSIINNQLRTAICMAETNCFLLTIDKFSFINNFGTLFNDLLQEADIRYTRNYSLPPWLKSMYGNNEFNNDMHSVSIKIPDLGSSISSISDDSNEMFSFEKEINKQLKKEKKEKKKKEKKKKGKKDKTNHSEETNTSTNSIDRTDNVDSNENEIDRLKSRCVSIERSLTVVNNEERIKKIKEEKEKKLNEIKLNEMKIFEKIKLKEEKKMKAFMKKKGAYLPDKSSKNNSRPSHTQVDSNIIDQNKNITTLDSNNTNNTSMSDKDKCSSRKVGDAPPKDTAGEGNEIDNIKEENREQHLKNKTNEVKEKYKNSVQQKSSSILKKKINPSNSSELNIDKLVKNLIGFICSEYNSIFHFYECIDKFNIGYIKYNDFLNFMICQNMEELFEGTENLENLFKYLCDGKNILTLIDFYKNVYRDKQIDKYELNLRLSEVYGSSMLAFKKIISQFNTQEDSLCNYENFQIVCEKVGLSKMNIENIWKEINIMNEENIPLEIIICILNGELFIEQSYTAYNEKKSFLNQVVNFFQGNDEGLTKMNTELIETNFQINYEDPIIINKCHHKSCSNECAEMVKLLETDVYFKFLTLYQRHFFATLMNRKIMNNGDILIKQSDVDSPIIYLYQGKANLISYNIFGIETITREIENKEIYGCYEVINEIPADYEVKISSDNAIAWILDRSSYIEHLKPMLNERKQNCVHILSILKNTPILRYMPEEVLDNISYAMKVEFHEPNHTIIQENTYYDKYYIICKGLATVEKNSEINKNKLILCTLRKGDYFGEMAIIKNEKRSANVILDTQAVLLSLVDTEFHRLLTPYFDQFLNRAKANYKKIKINNEPLPTEIARISSKTNVANIASLRSSQKKVTIQELDEKNKFNTGCSA